MFLYIYICIPLPDQFLWFATVVINFHWYLFMLQLPILLCNWLKQTLLWCHYILIVNFQMFLPLSIFILAY